HDRQTGQHRPQHRIDGLNGLDDPEHDVVHPTSVKPAAEPYAVKVPAPLPLTAHVVARPVDAHRSDVGSLFAHLFDDAGAALWLDAGTDPREGWSIIGTGPVEDAPEAVRRVDLSGAAEASGIPFLGGWVGWLPYEHGAAANGAPIADSPA